MYDTNIYINENPKLREQEYVPIPPKFHNKLNDGIPVIWRIKKNTGGWKLGDCPWDYGQIFLDEIWEQFKDEPIEIKISEIGEWILEVYFHEFLHAYFFRRMFPEDMEKEYYVKPDKAIQQVKGKLRSESWGNSEKMVGLLAKQLMYHTLIYDDNLPQFLFSTLRDEFEAIQQIENTQTL
jgi:hypothetical protein